MTTATVVRYRTKPEHAEENERLIREVFAELAAARPDGLRYASFRIDGESFLHVAITDGEQNPLTSSEAFAKFQEGIGDRCEEGPAVARGQLIGSYGWLAG
jgi:hypothetical protein